MRNLIVSADDFGLAGSINEGIAMSCAEGIVTHVNLIPTGEAFKDALERAKSLKNISFGAHLALTETSPISSSAEVRTLIGKDGRFHKHSVDFMVRLYSNKIDQSELYGELKAQLDAIKSAGISVVNISSHEHIHIVPRMLEVFVRLAKEYGIGSIRCPIEKRMTQPFTLKKIYKSAIFSAFGSGTRKVINTSGLKTTDDFLGFFDSGNINEKTLASLLGSIRDGATELVTHPGFLGPEVLGRYTFHKDCEYELSALTSPHVKHIIRENGIRLTGF